MNLIEVETVAQQVTALADLAAQRLDGMVFHFLRGGVGPQSPV
jgi:hypothetical protein